MEKFFMRGAAMLVLGGFIAGCSHDDEGYSSIIDSKLKAYQEVFTDAYGKIDPNQYWGFSLAASQPSSEEKSSTTRTIAVNEDLYQEFNFPSDAELAAAYPTSIPAGADEVPADGSFEYYYGNGAGHNYKITAAGSYNIGGSWQNTVWDGTKTIADTYNVYVNVDGDVTLTRNGNANFNLYIMKGNVTLGSDFGEMGGVISVYNGATLNDNRDHIACNYGVKLFNRGTVNVGRYDIGNTAIVYNEARFTATGALTYSAGAGNTSYFYNRGDGVELTAPSMTLNSTCHFFTDGVVNISGETFVTQRDIVWVNNGHYTTGTMNFSAKNGTFYNYCQLIVVYNCKFLDGEFNMMDNSYAEFGTGMFDNFIVNMHDNSGLNVLRGSKFERQGQGTFQGFRASDDYARVFVRLAGQTYVPSHNGGAFHVQGANLTLAYESIKFYNEYTGDFSNYSSFDSPTYWDETTAERLIETGDGRITWDTHNVTKFVTGADFVSTGFTRDERDCAATWNGDPETVTIPIDQGETTEDRITIVTTKEKYETTQLIEQGRVFCEDLGRISTNDLDFNDVVFDAYVYKITPSTRTIVKEDGVVVSDTTEEGQPTYKTTIILLAAGGTLPLSIAGSYEVHNVLGGNPTSAIINTIENAEGSYNNTWFTHDPVTLGTDFNYASIVEIPIRVLYSNGEVLELTAEQGWAPHKILVPIGTKWCKERVNIANAYKNFLDYVGSSQNFWEGNVDTSSLYYHPKDTYTSRSTEASKVLKSTEGPTTTYRSKGTWTTTGGYNGEEVLSRKNSWFND